MQRSVRSSAASVSASPSLVPRAHAPAKRSVAVEAVRDVFMPALSSTMTEGKIVSWLKSVGDKVKKGEALVVVESDKADMDVESFAEGILGAIVVQEGERASVGAPIAFVAESAAEVDEAKKKAAALGGGAAAAPAPTPAPVSRPRPLTSAAHLILSIVAPPPP
jgi:pyruvate dehydrogenase E2 component (dihydrolipoamide acetyltransferase)